MDAAEPQTLIDQLYDVLSLFRKYQEAKRFRNHVRASSLLAELRKATPPVISLKAYMLVVETLVRACVPVHEVTKQRTGLEELEQTLDRRERDLVNYVDQLQGAMSGSDSAWWSRPAGGDGAVR